MDNLIEHNTSSIYTVDESKRLYVNNAGHYIISQNNYPTYRPNGRKDYQLIYIMKGKMQIVINGKSQKITDGTVVLYKPNEPQIYSFLCEIPGEFYWIHFYGTDAPKIFEDLKINSSMIIHIGENHKIPTLINSCLANLISQKFGFDYSNNGNLLQILSIVAYFNTQSAIKTRDDLEIFNNVLLAMHNINSSFSLKQYANMCNMSVSHFCHLFKDIFGISPHLYNQKNKINQSTKLLAETNYSVKEISALLGFEDVYYFSRVFKKHVGIAPKHFRDKLHDTAFESAETEFIFSHTKIEKGKAVLAEIPNDKTRI
jgi:AraC-like DNA-binding protein